MAFWFWILVLLLIFMIFAWPTWPYTRGRWVYRRGGRWRYAPSAGAGAGLVLILLCVWLGVIAISYPWYGGVGSGWWW
jgi:ribose/xylose/arabinose/galactoside ABC-type transport system permease subunit